MKSRPNRQTEEERVFNGALVVLEMHFQRPGVYMKDTMGEAKKMVAKTLDLSLNKAEVRYAVLVLGSGIGADDLLKGESSQERRCLETPKEYLHGCHRTARITLFTTNTHGRRGIKWSFRIHGQHARNSLPSTNTLSGRRT